MRNYENREERAAEVEAVVKSGGVALTATYNGQKYELTKGHEGSGHTYSLTVGDYGPVTKIEEGEAGEYKMPSLLVYLDECLNIIEMSGLGKRIAQQTVYDVIDKMIDEHAATSISAGRTVRR